MEQGNLSRADGFSPASLPGYPSIPTRCQAGSGCRPGFRRRHSDPAMTLRVYAHLMPSSRERTRKAIATAYNGGPIRG